MTTVPLNAPLAHMIAHIGTQHGAEAQQLAVELVKDIGKDAQIILQIDAFDVLCRACDAYRERGDKDRVKKLKRLVEAIKHGPRHIHGVMNLGGLAKAIGQAAEDGAKVVAIESPGSDNKVEIARLTK